MADALLSPFLDQLITVIREMVEHEVRLVAGVDDAVENMRRNLQAIKVVLKDAEKRQWKDEAVKVWMDELKDVTYDMDDILNMWKTMIEKDYNGKYDVETDRNASVVKKIKVCLSVLCRCFNSCPLERQVHHRLDIACKMERLNTRLDSIGSRKDRFNFTSVSSSTSNTNETRRPNFSTSVIDVPVVYGQDKYKKTVLDHLICKIGEESTIEQNLYIIPVVGMGGIGKTTLAKEVFNDQRVKENFNVRAWVCVSEPFDRLEIAKAIVQQLNSDDREGASTSTCVGDHNWETLMKKFVASINDEKFLIVLDDVWTDDLQEWRPLEHALRSGAAGSRVLVTTRKEGVAKMVGETHKVCMGQLSNEDSWLLFKEITSLEKNEEREELKPIGEEIVRKCQGLPLAVKTLASLLCNKSKKEWQDVLQSDLWELEEDKFKKVEKNLISPLLLSYYDLPSKEKRCFSYCAIFPKDYEINKNDLIQQWMAQGYFGLRNHAMEAEGQKCFDNLAMRSLFQDLKYNLDGSIETCKMHDIVHDFVQFLTLNEFSTLAMNENIAQKEDLMTNGTRHLSFVPPSALEGLIPAISILKKKKLRTLMVRSSEIFKIHPDHILYLRCLRTLNLSQCSLVELPKNIDELILLRYLDLSDNYLSALPSTIGNLYNMQTLILHKCSHFSGDCLPKEIGKLENLMMFSLEFRSNHHSSKFQLEDFGKLKNLHDLVMYDLKIAGHTGGPLLHENQNLYSLVLYFDPWRQDAETEDNSALEAIQPHPNLQHLHVHGYLGHGGPSWLLTLTNLRSLSLEFCDSPKILHALGKLQSLETLKLRGLRGIDKVGPEFLGAEIEDNMSTTRITSTTGQGDDGSATTVILFPKLKRILFNLPFCREWVGIPGWSVDSLVRIMPCLEYLKLQDCVFLEVLPDFLQTTPLKHLVMANCLWGNCLDPPRKEWTKIQHVPDIQFL